MRIVQITPGAGGMYCGNCLRDNALVAAWRRQGHDVTMVPLYLPLTLDESDHSAGTPIFFSGVNVFLDQKSPRFRSAPEWLRRWLSSATLLRWVGGLAAKTRPQEVAELALSMLRGEEGHQARDLDELIGWLRGQPRPDALCLSNALLLGLTRRIRHDLGGKVVCLLAGEDAYLDAMPEPWRGRIWEVLKERARLVDLFVAPSRYFADVMRARLGLDPERVQVISPALNLEGYPPEPTPAAHLRPGATDTPAGTIGFFARMCREKGLDTLVEAFLRLRQKHPTADVRLKVGGSCGPADQPLVDELRARLAAAGALDRVEFHPNLDRAAKIRFLQSLTVFSTPALYGEAFGLYLLEAMAAGVPVVQPRHAAFPEVIEATGGGVLCDPGDAAALADAIEGLLRDPVRREALARAGHRAVHEQYGAGKVAERMIAAFESMVPGATPALAT